MSCRHGLGSPKGRRRPKGKSSSGGPKRRNWMYCFPGPEIVCTPDTSRQGRQFDHWHLQRWSDVGSSLTRCLLGSSPTRRCTRLATGVLHGFKSHLGTHGGPSYSVSLCVHYAVCVTVLSDQNMGKENSRDNAILLVLVEFSLSSAKIVCRVVWLWFCLACLCCLT